MGKKFVWPQSELAVTDLLAMFIQGSKWLEVNLDTINAINVFPVPDGDTGTNMLLTMKSIEEAVNGAQIIPGESIDVIVKAMARGALMGARGNSGVILAQFFQGLTRDLAGYDKFDCYKLNESLRTASNAAYAAVGEPSEGTMLTVMREVADAAELQCSFSDDMLAMWEAMCSAARESVRKSPELLPVLKEAGVVDAGGQGFLVILEGALGYLKNQEPRDIEIESVVPYSTSDVIRESFLAGTKNATYGYCTQLLVEGENLDIDSIKDEMNLVATSTVVIGGSNMARFHVHTEEPGTILSYAINLGRISEVSVVSMDGQHEELLRSNSSDKVAVEVGILAVASGSGLKDIFLDSGVSVVLSGGDTMNPSVQEILDAVQDVKANSVIVLPNNDNIILAAEQASSISTKPMRVIPTKSIPQGIAALLTFNTHIDLEENISAMGRSASRVTSAAVFMADRDSAMSGIKVRKGQFAGMIERNMVISGDDCNSVLLELIDIICAPSGSFITLYRGSDTSDSDALCAVQAIESRFNGLEVELALGGQPHYNYLVSVE